MSLEELATLVDEHLVYIQQLLPAEYRLTLVARHTSNPRAHVLMTGDDLTLAAEAIRQVQSDPNHKHLPPNPG